VYNGSNLYTKHIVKNGDVKMEYEIINDNLQMVVANISPGEMVYGEAGAMVQNQTHNPERELNCKIVAGNVSISNVDSFLSALRNIAHKYAVTIQAMDAELIAGEEHIKSAVEKALRAVTRQKSITSDLGLETLLYAAGKRQIERALAMGVSEGEKKVALVIVTTTVERNLQCVAEEVKRQIELHEVPIEELESYSGNKKENLKNFFGITEAEIKAVGEKKLKMLVLERVALLDVLK
jgi:KEOPS complex subunit Cgi121